MCICAPTITYYYIISHHVVYICMYIYIYIYTHLSLYIYIYIYVYMLCVHLVITCIILIMIMINIDTSIQPPPTGAPEDLGGRPARGRARA